MNNNIWQHAQKVVNLRLVARNYAPGSSSPLRLKIHSTNCSHKTISLDIPKGLADYEAHDIKFLITKIILVVILLLIINVT